MCMEKIALTREKETLLITLYAKARESLLPESILKDRHAAAAVGRINYDFSRLRMRRDEMIGLALRAHTLDGWAREFIAAHPEATVLHLGCGLDTRVQRVDPPPGIDWYEVDYPEVIALRRSLYPARPGCTLVGSPVTDPEWLARIPAGRPTLVVAEGLFLYLAEDALLQLLRTVTAKFPSGEVVFDSYNRLGLTWVAHNRMIRSTGAVTRWSLRSPQALEGQVPGLRLRTERGGYESDDSRQRARYSWPAQAALWLMRRVRPLGGMTQLLRYHY
ncbi:polyketide synthesis O-methyltransferase [Achromobacter arsenitoxydans SY8]|uniref:Polyketide synthesis O-methyltransferase n=2 Tax=Achromobacter TaxID=222 RepID=H0FDG8_9BURK|nr:polyketide synthesis O-methyltransferase [Achromobacter arsenitoxydans SY8]